MESHDGISFKETKSKRGIEKGNPPAASSSTRNAIKLRFRLLISHTYYITDNGDEVRKGVA